MIGPQGTKHCFWDVGANSGQHSLFAATLGARVEAFEPWPVMIERFSRNADINPALPITLHPFGLADANTARSYAAPTGANLAGGSFVDNAIGDRLPGLPLRRGDDLVSEGLPPPTFLKIDVEGYEPHVLAGLAETLARHRPIIIAEHSLGTARELGDRRFASLLPHRYLVKVIAGAERPLLRPLATLRNGDNLLCVPMEHAGLL